MDLRFILSTFILDDKNDLAFGKKDAI